MAETTPAPAPAQRSSGSAIAALIMGIAGIVVFPVIFAPLAIIFGKRAQREIAQDPSVGGAGMAKAGIVLGWIGVALVVISILIIIGVLATR